MKGQGQKMKAGEERDRIQDTTVDLRLVVEIDMGDSKLAQLIRWMQPCSFVFLTH
jgi:hypothetical protein